MNDEPLGILYLVQPCLSALVASDYSSYGRTDWNPQAMKTFTALYALLSILFASAAIIDQPLQEVLGRPKVNVLTDGDRNAIIEQLLATYDDPVHVMRLLDPENASELDSPRLLQIFGTEAVWMTEGDKLRLRRQGLGFIDLTNHQDLYTSSHEPAESSSFTLYSFSSPS
jgi:leucyl aminopeptidase